MANATCGLINETSVRKVLSVVDAGLIYGLGNPKPGQMCVEAAVSYAMGEEHDDHPTCVDSDLADFKINLNDDERWGTKAQRAKGLRRLAIAQLGTANSFNFYKFETLFNKQLDALVTNEHKNRLIAGINKAEDSNTLSGFIEAYRDEINSNFDPNELINTYADFSNTKAERLARLNEVAEIAVQILIKLNTPGSKYLYLTER